MAAVERWVERLTVALIVAACCILLHRTQQFIATRPFLNVDDSIPNVAITLAERARYGFLSSPTQGLHQVDRTHAFFNYGPLYFWFAAAVTWVLGPSLVLYRMLHPIGILAVALVFTGSFRRVAVSAAAILTVVLFDLYLTAHWPLARPDVAVSVCAALTFVFAARAIERGRRADWWAMGFFAGSAVTSHQIAAAMVPAAGLVWLWAQAAERGLERRGRIRMALRSLTALVFGGVCAGLVFLIAIDFRVLDLLALGTVRMTSFAASFMSNLESHFSYAWSSVAEGRFRWLVGGFAAAALVSAAAPWLPGRMRRQALAYIMPALVVATLYQLSLGFYGSNHTGYVILSQVATVWAIAAVVALFIAWARESGDIAARAAALAMSILVLGYLAAADGRWIRTPSMWETRALGNVSAPAFIRRAVAPLPERASVWGSLYFGLDAGNRTDLVQFLQTFDPVAKDFKPDRRATLAPDYLLLSSYETDIDFARYLADLQTMNEAFVELFSTLRYGLSHLVYAPPYGVARGYERVPAGGRPYPTAVPAVSVNDGVGRQWSSQLREVAGVTFQPAAPVTANISFYGLNPIRAASASVRGELPPGFYLIEVALDRPDPAQVGFVLATPGSYFYWRGGWADFAVPAAPYLPGDPSVMVLVDHPGGALYLSRFENPRGSRQLAVDVWRLTRDAATAAPKATAPLSLQVTSVRSVAVLSDRTGRLPEIGVPALDEWSVATPGVAFKPRGGGRFDLSGTIAPSAVLVESPPIPVPRGHRLAITLPLEMTSGGVEVGVRVPGEGWLGGPLLMPRRVVVDTGNAAAIVIAIRNSDLGATPPVAATIMPPQVVATLPPEPYVDRLMACRSPYIPEDPEDCARFGQR